MHQQPNQDVDKILQYLAATSPPLLSYVKEHLRRLTEDTHWIEANCAPTDAILDIGSFPWFTPAYLSMRGFRNILTVDIDRKDLFERAPEWTFQSMALDIEETPLPVKDGSIDVVVLFEVFEHLYRRPNLVFREVSRVLKKGGRLLLTTPNGASFPSLRAAMFHKRMGPSLYDASCVYEDLGHFSHIREYSVHELREYLGHFGLNVEHCGFRSFVEPDQKMLWTMEGLVSAVFPSLRRNLFVVARLHA